MDAEQLTDLLDRLAPVAPTVWLAGGWGVDALVGRQTRPHGDADLMLDADHLPAVLDLLRGLGFTPTEDWLPVRIEVEHPDGRRVDLHPVVLAADGSGVQAGLHGTTFDYPPGSVTTGTVAGREVRCCTAATQLAFRRGFDLRPVDHHDITELRALRSPPGQRRPGRPAATSPATSRETPAATSRTPGPGSGTRISPSPTRTAAEMNRPAVEITVALPRAPRDRHGTGPREQVGRGRREDGRVERVRELWASVAGVAVPATGVRVVCRPGSGLAPPGWVGSVSVGDGMPVTAPTDELAAVVQRRSASGSTVDAVLARLGAETLGPARLAYVESVVAPGDVEWVGPDGLDELFAAVGPAGLDESGLTGIGAAVVREGGRVVVAAAGWHPWPAQVAHIGVLTAAAARGRGLATRAAAAATADALAAGRLPQWRARVPASERVAAKLGYRVLGRQLGVRPGGPA